MSIWSSRIPRSSRSDGVLAKFDRILVDWAVIAGVNAPIVALPQDEFINTDALERAIEVFGVEHVYSVADPSQ